ncbi:MAG: hypothetical protein ABR606_03365 [Vicinamibacterales bacterium]
MPTSTHQEGTRRQSRSRRERTGGWNIRQILRDGLDAQLGQQKQRATAGLGAVSSIIKESSQPLRHEGQSAVADYIDQFAERVDRFSGSLDTLELEDVVGGVEDFARRQPALFVATAFGLGLLSARFFKSSTGGWDGPTNDSLDAERWAGEGGFTDATEGASSGTYPTGGV